MSDKLKAPVYYAPTGEQIYFDSLAENTFMEDGTTVEDTLKNVKTIVDDNLTNMEENVEKALDVGTENLISNGDFQYINRWYTSGVHTIVSTPTIKHNNYGSLRINTSEANNGYIYTDFNGSEYLEDYTLSFYAKGVNKDITLHCDFVGGNNSEDLLIKYANWTRYIVNLKGTDVSRLRFWLKNEGGIYISEVKLVKGKNVSHDFSLNEKDVEERLLNKLYPVNTGIYFTLTKTNPSSILGIGTWKLIAQGQTLVGVGTGKDSNGRQKTFNAGSNNGEYWHTMSINELPVHSHNQKITAGNGSDPNIIRLDYNADAGGTGAKYEQGVNTGDTGGGQPFNVTTPSFGVYIWQRIA